MKQANVKKKESDAGDLNRSPINSKVDEFLSGVKIGETKSMLQVKPTSC